MNSTASPARRAAPALLAALLLGVAGAAQAHAHLLRSEPAADASAHPGDTLRLTFSEPLVARFSTVTLVSAAGAKPAVAVTASPDRATLIAKPKAPLAPGAYKVQWRVVSADGHKVGGSYNLTVG